MESGHMNQLDSRLQHGRRGMVRAEIDVPPTPPDPNRAPPAPQTPPAPTTPTDEPPPVPVQDPPAESEPKPPLTVDNQTWSMAGTGHRMKLAER
jgi:hypothetical protein